MYTAAILGWDITLVRIVSALFTAMVFGTVTTFAFYREELRRLSEVHALMSQGTATLIAVIREQTKEPSCCSVGQIPEEVDAMGQTMEECGVEVQVVNLVNPDQVNLLDRKLIRGIVEPSDAVEAILEALKEEMAKS